jgi:integrase
VPFNRPLPHFATPEDLANLKRAIAAMGERSGTYMLTEEGNPRSQKAASSWFSKAARKAGLPLGQSSHGLRKSRMILHAERGATIHQIAAWSGHETLKEIERYTREVGKRRLLTPGTAPFSSWLETGEFL